MKTDSCAPIQIIIRMEKIKIEKNLNLPNINVKEIYFSCKKMSGIVPKWLKYKSVSRFFG
jgi:hypothetical protein